MDKKEWKLVEAAFEKAVRLEGSARDALVAEFAESNPELHRRLTDLLAADGLDDRKLEEPIAVAARIMSEQDADPWEGRQIGAWAIQHRIADGGMGAVFLAERSDEQYRQTAALKVMTAQVLARDAAVRFRAERQILASLNHANIAKLLDGGSTEEHLPYLVMEYIDGLPIDRYCDEQRLGIAERLALFTKVCEAVDYAHRNLVVHRDLKPANILVDTNGDPKLLDFGIAKLLEAESPLHTMAVTRAGMRAMTPEYASPEQVRGEPISVASDVYALGVLLYRLMTGQSPYGVSATTPREYEAAILGDEPRKPSTVVTSPETGASAGSSRATSPQGLQRRLRGDLDNIVLRALQKEPERRYATAGALAADIGRYLAHQPVEARGNDWPYRARKFVVRNARNLAFAMTVFVAGAALTIYYTAKLADERDRANLAAAQSQEVAAFLTGLFESASPHEAKGEAITAVDLLEQGRERIDELDGQPRLKAELMRIMASSMTAMGETRRSVLMLQRALELKEADVPNDEISISQTTHNLAEAYRQLGELDKAEHYLRRTLEIATAEFGADNSDVAYLMSRLGVILFDARRVEEALDIERRAVAIMAANDDGETPDALDARGNISNALASLGRYEEAAQSLRETIALSERVIGELHPNTIIRRTNLCRILIRLGEFEEAVRILDEDIPRGVRVWGADYDHVANMHGVKAAALKRLGRMRESLENYRAAQEITRNRIGEDNRIYVRKMRGTASALMDMAHYDAAESLLQDALSKAVLIDGDRSADANILRLLSAQLDNDLGRYAKAEAELRPLSAERGTFGMATYLVLKRELANALSAQGKFDEAEALIVDVIAGQEESAGIDNPVNLPSYAVAAEHFRRRGELNRSLEYGERLAAIVESDPRPLTWTGALALIEYGRTLSVLRRSDDARRQFERAYEVLQATFGESDPRVAEVALLIDRNPSGTVAPGDG